MGLSRAEGTDRTACAPRGSDSDGAKLTAARAGIDAGELAALDNRGSQKRRPERVESVDYWRQGVRVLAICASVWGKPMGCTLDDVPGASRTDGSALAGTLRRWGSVGCRWQSRIWLLGVAEARRPKAGI